MNFPAIVKKSFDELRNQPEFLAVFNFVVEGLKGISDPIKRAKFVHEEVDAHNAEVFNHPLVKQLSPCKAGCSACCHTQVSVTQDEAHLLAQKIKEGTVIDLERLKLQMEAGNDHDEYYKLSFEERKCIFLDKEGSCRVYGDRPSVCRTNAVLGTPTQCDTSQMIIPTRLVKTAKANMAIYGAYLNSKENGTLPQMIGEELGLKVSVE